MDKLLTCLSGKKIEWEGMALGLNFLCEIAGRNWTGNQVNGCSGAMGVFN